MPLASQYNAMYELFVRFDSANINQVLSLGKFNVNSSGQLVDTGGIAATFQFRYYVDLNIATEAFVTIEPKVSADTLPTGPKIMGCVVRTITNGALVFSMDMYSSDVLGNIAAEYFSDSAKYILASPTAGDPHSHYTRGIWFTPDTTHSVAGINCAALDSSLGWIYHAYVIDNRNPTQYIYNVGRFWDPNASDDYNQCNGNGQPWNKPGQDWLTSNCPGGGLPDITDDPQYNLNNSDYLALITIEPITLSSSLTQPFFIHLFYGTINVPDFDIARELPNVAANTLPTGVLTLTSTIAQ